MALIKVKAQVSTRYIGSTRQDEFEVEVPDNLIGDEREDYIRDNVFDWVCEQIEWWWEEIE